MLSRLASWLSRSWRGLLSPDELQSVGYIALRKAAERFDEHRATPFPAYAHKWVRGAMIRALRTEHQIMSGMNEASYRAVVVLEDNAYDDGERHRQQLGAFSNAVLSSSPCGAVSKARADESLARDMGFADPDGTIKLRMLPEAIALLNEERAALIRRHWLEEESLHRISEEQGIPYTTLKRRHRRALAALARSLNGLLARCLAC